MADQVLLTNNGKPELGEAEVAAFSILLRETEAMRARRLLSCEAYQAQQLPDRVQHLWRYTDPHRLLPAESLPAPPARVVVPAELLPRTGPAVLLLPGVEPQLNRDALATGIVLQPLAAAGENLRLLGSAVADHNGLFTALNGAAWTAGLYVRVPRGLSLAEPLRIIVPAAAATNLPRLLVHVEQGAALTVVEEQVGGTGERHVIGVSELVLEAGAHLRHVLLQEWGESVVGHLTCRGHLSRDADLLTVLASLGGAVAKLDLGAILAGPGSHSELIGVALGEGHQHLDHHTTHHHLAAHTSSRLDFKVALTGRARSVYTGLIRIEDDAVGCEAYQENRNLLLSDRCRVDTIPELEICTDEVSCSHGATVAPVDPEQLYYLESRGIPAAAALRLVVRGFLEDTLRHLPARLHPGIEELVDRRLAVISGGVS